MNIKIEMLLNLSELYQIKTAIQFIELCWSDRIKLIFIFQLIYFIRTNLIVFEKYSLLNRRKYIPELKSFPENVKLYLPGFNL